MSEPTGLPMGGLQPVSIQPSSLAVQIDQAALALQDQLITWRRDLHQHPELGNRWFLTSELVAKHLRDLGMEVRTGVAHTGVVALLKGALPGPVVALRADMDGLPVSEEVDVPFASRAKAPWNGAEVGVMHACGHDAHLAILMRVADGQRRHAEDHRARPPDAWRGAVRRGGPDRHRSTGGAGVADGGQPQHRHHARAGGGDHRRQSEPARSVGRSDGRCARR